MHFANRDLTQHLHTVALLLIWLLLLFSFISRFGQKHPCTFTYHLADTSDLRRRTIEAIKPTIGQQYASAVTSP